MGIAGRRAQGIAFLSPLPLVSIIHQPGGHVSELWALDTAIMHSIVNRKVERGASLGPGYTHPAHLVGLERRSKYRLIV